MIYNYGDRDLTTDEQVFDFISDEVDKIISEMERKFSPEQIARVVPSYDPYWYNEKANARSREYPNYRMSRQRLVDDISNYFTDLLCDGMEE